MKAIARQASLFSVVAALSFVIDYAIMMLLSFSRGFDPVLAAGISFVAANVFNYLVAMRLVCQHREELSRVHEFLLFVVLACVGLLINEAIIFVAMYLFDETPLTVSIAKLVASATVTLWNFFSRRRWLDGSWRTQE